MLASIAIEKKENKRENKRERERERETETEFEGKCLSQTKPSV